MLQRRRGVAWRGACAQCVAFAQFELGFDAAGRRGLAIPRQRGIRIARHSRPEHGALAEQEHGAGNAAGGGGLKVPHRLDGATAPFSVDVQHHAQAIAGLQIAGFRRATPQTPGLIAILGNAATMKVATG